jgi:FlaG/FlaF family flagellin (archaellin)
VARSHYRDMSSRGISPAVGAVLLVAIGVTMATVAAVAILDTSREREPQPSAALDVEVGDDGVTHVLVHGGGETIDGAKMTFRGAVNNSAFAGERISVNDEMRFYPVAENVSVIYTGEHGTNYLLGTFDTEATVPERDVGCEWVQEQTDGGTDSITVDRVVDCDIDTDGQVTVQSGGVVLGAVTSNNNDVTIQDGDVYQDVTAGGAVTLENGTVTRSISADDGVTVGADVSATVNGDITAGGQTDIANASIDGDIDTTGDISIEDSVVSGSVTADGSLDCENSTVDGENCGGSTSDGGPSSVVFTQSGDLRTLASNGTAVTDWSIGGVRALGPKTVDFDGDGTDDIPYLTDASSVWLVDGNDGSPREIDIGSAQADTQKTALTVGSWDGSPTSVFYAGDGHSTIYRVAPGGSPVAVTSPGNGVNVVLGPGDIDGDGTAELVFADGSQTIRYLEPDGTIESTGETAGSSNNIGAARPVDLDGDGTATVPIVDGSNQILLVDSDGVAETIITGSDDEQAAKSHIAVADIDEDGASEIVYLENNDSPADLRYVDDVGGSNTFESVYDDSGDRIPGDKKRGVVP